MIGGTPRELRWVLAGFDALANAMRTAGHTPPDDFAPMVEHVRSALVRQHPPTQDDAEQRVDHGLMFAMLFEYDDVVAATRLGKRTLERLVAAGELPAVTVAGRTMFKPAEVAAFVDALPPKETTA